jgi:heme exporter protein A
LLTTPHLLECRSISFERDDIPLFSGVSFQLSPFQAIQITGPNGAGKTTLLRILATSLQPTEGEVLWRGLSVQQRQSQYQENMLYLGHNAGVKSSLTPRENLQWYFRLFPAMDLQFDSALRRVNLQGYENVPCHTLSAGQQRRVALARLHLSSASLWILDEPFTSIDVHGVALLESLMTDHLAQGGAIVLTSHQHLGLPNVQVLDLESFAVVD